MKLECNCKNISIDWLRTEGPLHSRICSCDYCQSQKAEYVSEPDSTFSFVVNDMAQHKMVKHGHKTASFHECKNCGLAFVSCRIDGVLYGILNAKVMGIENCILEPEPRDYSGEIVENRLARRKQNWCRVNS